MSEEREGLGTSEREEQDWIEYLADFKAEIFPIFASHGMTMAEALTIWKMTALRNEIVELERIIEDHA